MKIKLSPSQYRLLTIKPCSYAAHLATMSALFQKRDVKAANDLVHDQLDEASTFAAIDAAVDAGFRVEYLPVPGGINARLYMLEAA